MAERASSCCPHISFDRWLEETTGRGRNDHEEVQSMVRRDPVFVVTDTAGEYSDRRTWLVAVYSTQAEADAAVAALQNDRERVREVGRRLRDDDDVWVDETNVDVLASIDPAMPRVVADCCHPWECGSSWTYYANEVPFGVVFAGVALAPGAH